MTAMTGKTGKTPPAWNEKVKTSWDGEDILADLVEERTISPEETAISIGNADLRNYYPAFVRSLAQLALYATEEKVRLEAASRGIKFVRDLEESEKKDDPLATFINKVLSDDGDGDATPGNDHGEAPSLAPLGEGEIELP